MPKEKSKKARNELSLKQKNQILEEYERSNGSLGVRRLAEKYSCGKTQVSNIIRNKDKLREQYEAGLPELKTRNRTSQYADLNDAVWEWFKKNTVRRIPNFATKVADKLGYADFKASSGSLTRFKERHNLSQHKVCGESADVPIGEREAQF